MAEVAPTSLPDLPAVPADSRAEFAALCRTIHPRLVGALALRCGDRRLAEDLAQEALARAWRDWPKVQAGGDAEPWVYTTAFNLLRSWHRRLRVARRRAPELAPSGTTPDGTDGSAAGLTVRRAVAALPPRQREAIALRYYADLPVRETAAVMGCAEGTVRALTAQAVAALRSTLGTDLTLDDEDLR